MSHAINEVFNAVGSAVKTVTNAVADVAHRIGDPLTEWVMKNDQKNFTKVIENDKKIFNTVDPAVKKLMNDYPWLKWVVVVVAAYFGFGGFDFGAASGEVAAGDSAAFEQAAIDASIDTGAVELPAGTIVDGVELSGGMSVPADSLTGAISTPGGSVVTTSGGSTLGQTVTDGLAYKVATASSEAGWFSTAKTAVDYANKASSVQRILNTKTGITQVIPKGSAVPAGWTLDTNWNQTAYEGINGPRSAMAMNVTEPTQAGTPFPIVAALVLLAGVIYLGNRS